MINLITRSKKICRLGRSLKICGTINCYSSYTTGGNLIKFYHNAWPNAFFCLKSSICCNMFPSKVMALVSRLLAGGICHILWQALLMCFYYAPQKISGEHIVVALSVRPSVRPSVSQSVRPSVCTAHNFVIWNRILKLFYRNDHHVETTCRAQHWVPTLKVKVTARPRSKIVSGP